ncbi:MAG TPA: hypothetical protein VGN69_11155 [Solirubrobacteraceae bacterium]|jgi:hypothetical protein|nr:hypothetical protein [Solirubrobacteraceae bacterium]
MRLDPRPRRRLDTRRLRSRRSRTSRLPLLALAVGLVRRLGLRALLGPGAGVALTVALLARRRRQRPGDEFTAPAPSSELAGAWSQPSAPATVEPTPAQAATNGASEPRPADGDEGGLPAAKGPDAAGRAGPGSGSEADGTESSHPEGDGAESSHPERDGAGSSHAEGAGADSEGQSASSSSSKG